MSAPARVLSAPAASRSHFCLRIPGRSPLELGRRTLIMGIVNVTPDSFSDGRPSFTADGAIEHGLRLAEAGADILDVGGESTRPGARPVPADEECRRILPVIESLASRSNLPVSIDTTKAGVGRAALEAGASLLNDVSMLRNSSRMAVLAAERGVPLILMHSRGTPGTMASLTRYPEGILEGMARELGSSLRRARAGGVHEDQLLIDPGLGFAKTTGQCIEILARLPRLAALGRPLVVGASRKSFIGRTVHRDVGRLREGTLAAEAAAVLAGCHIIRTHDVAACRPAVDLMDALLRVRGTS
ncbi:MAG: dihydropteroate synthase [Acidobacteriota bacterium]